METILAFLCDYADTSGGKINALGIGFNTIHAPKVPATHRLFFVVLKLKAGITEAGAKSIEISLIDADGKHVIPKISGSLTFPEVQGVTETFTQIAVAFNNVKFPEYGEYSLEVVIQGIRVASLPLKVSPLQPVTK